MMDEGVVIGRNFYRSGILTGLPTIYSSTNEHENGEWPYNKSLQ